MTGLASSLSHISRDARELVGPSATSSWMYLPILTLVDLVVAEVGQRALGGGAGRVEDALLVGHEDLVARHACVLPLVPVPGRLRAVRPADRLPPPHTPPLLGLQGAADVRHQVPGHLDHDEAGDEQQDGEYAKYGIARVPPAAATSSMPRNSR